MTRPARLLTLAVLGLAAGCSGGAGCGGCGTLDPIPGGRFTGEKVDNGMSVRLTASGIGVINTNWQVLLAQFAPGNVMNVPMKCSVNNVAIIGNLAMADQGAAGCTAESCGRMDGKCDGNDLPANIAITFHGLNLVPKAPDIVEGNLDMTIATGKLFVDSVSRNSAVCLFTSPLKCGVDFDSARSDAGPADNTFNARIKFVINQRWDKLLSFEVASIGGSAACGSSGAGAPPNCIDPADLSITTEGSCVTCGAASFDAVKTMLIGQVVSSLQGSIQDAVDDASCQKCSAGEPTCPQLAPAASTCQVDVDGGQDSGFCIDTTTQKCVPAILGVEGRMNAGAMLPGLGVPEDSQLDLSIAAGGTASCDTGINVGMRGGTREVAVADCVKAQPAPVIVALPPPAFDSSAPVGGYDLGLGVSRQFLDNALHHAGQSGVMCIAITGDKVPQLSSGLFKPIVPSLGMLTPKDEDVPMMVVLRPGASPTVRVGEGSIDPVTGKPIDPLITVTMKDLGVDFYALIDDRQVRLFTLLADVAFPLSLVFEGCTDITPAVGSLAGAITNVRATNSEIVAENLTALESLIPLFIGLAEPQLSAGMQPFALPPFGEFKLQVLTAKGLSPVAAGTGFEHLGMYAKLLRVNAACVLSAPKTHAALARSVMPKAEEMRARGQVLPWPVAVLAVRSEGAAGTAQFATRVNGGMWSDFAPAGPGGELEVSHPVFLLQGAHRIEVRSRFGEHPRAVSAPVEVGFVVDYAPPEVTLAVDREHDRLVVRARDTVSPQGALRFAYRVGQEAWGEFGPARQVDLGSVEAGGGLTVRVRDEQGNVAEAAYRVPVIATRAEAPEGSAGAVSSGGCSAAGGALGSGVLVLLAGVLVRRRRR
ncbi:MAG: LBP/BPI/CETP family protein [Myxococcaceae bacterium]